MRLEKYGLFSQDKHQASQLWVHFVQSVRSYMGRQYLVFLQLNNVTERMSRTIIRSVILRTTQLLESFRGEGNDTTSYLINISPSIPLNFGLLRRVWARKDISCSHLKVSRCKFFSHVAKE